MKHNLLMLATIIAIGAGAVAQAQQGGNGNRPTDKIAADLMISERDFIACFADVRPDTNHTPSGTRQQANKAVLLPCLQTANPAITNDWLDQVMDRYRPEGPMRNP